VLSRHRRDRRVLRRARVRRFLAVAELARLARRDSRRVVVPPRDARLQLALRERELVVTELGAAQELEPGGEDGIEALLQAVPGEDRRVQAGSALDARAARLELVVELVARLRLRPAGAPGLAVEAQQADLGGGLLAGPAADPRRAADERQLVVLLQEDDEPVRERDPPGLLRHECAQRGLADLAPVLRLSACERGQREGRDEQDARAAHHFWPPSFAVAMRVDSISATVRFASTKVVFATRRTSAAVTFWMRSTSWNSPRQSP